MDIQKLFKMGMDRDIPELLDMPDGIILNLGAGTNIKQIPGIPLDLPWNADHQPIPFNDGKVAGIHAYHFFEHLHNPLFCLSECQRVLKPGGVLNIVVPYYSAQCYAQDLDHKHPFCETTWVNSFKNPYYKKGGVAMDWCLTVRVNIIIGVVEWNLCLLTQMVKIPL